jgi:hypothetical protein
MKINQTQGNYIPDLEYLIYQYFSFFHLDDLKNRKLLAEDLIKRYQEVLNKNINQGEFDTLDLDILLQLSYYFFDSIYCATPSEEESMPPFVPNLICFLNINTFEPRLPIIKALIDKGFLTVYFGMLFENWLLMGFENRIYDGLPIFWNGDINSIVTLFCILYFLKEIETDDAFDTKEHREYPQDEKEKKQQSKEKPTSRPNFTTLIGGKYIQSRTGKAGNGNFIIEGEDSYKKWATINRRCKGIYYYLNDFFNELINGRNIKNVPKEKLLDFLIKNKYRIFNSKEKDYQIDLQIIDLVCDCYSKTNTSDRMSLLPHKK